MVAAVEEEASSLSVHEVSKSFPAPDDSNTRCLALEGVSQLLDTLERVRLALNPSLEIDGVLMTMYDDRTNLSRQVVEEVRSVLGERVYTTVVPRNIRLGEAPSHGKPILLYDIRSRGAEAYLSLAREFMAHEEKRVGQGSR